MAQPKTFPTMAKAPEKGGISRWLRNFKERREFKKELLKGDIRVVVDRMQKEGDSVRNVAILLNAFNFDVRNGAAYALERAALKDVNLTPLLGMLEKRPYFSSWP